ncbi:MAG: histidinol-phosphatase HisJ family protein [Lachnospiraceae bacterium]|nr:histidinol-phosphatase HisJ family protein [Lachnospiraceae bacterium]
MILSDFHIHSSNSGDSETKLQAQIESAISKGIKHLCITEHMDFDYPLPPKGYEDETCNFILDGETYFSEYNQMKHLLCSDEFHLYFGVELGLQLHVNDMNKDFVNKYPFDFVIASSHVFDNSDPYFPPFWEGKNELDILRRYFESIYENICNYDDFDIYGHLDYIIRYGKDKGKNFKYSLFSDEIDSILKKLIEMGKGIEINTGGLKNGLKYPNPNPEILKRYKELGGEIITVGSDAHTPEYVGYKFDVALNLLLDCGFNYITIFKDRKPIFINI